MQIAGDDKKKGKERKGREGKGREGKGRERNGTERNGTERKGKVHKVTRRYILAICGADTPETIPIKFGVRVAPAM